MIKNNSKHRKWKFQYTFTILFSSWRVTSSSWIIRSHHCLISLIPSFILFNLCILQHTKSKISMKSNKLGLGREGTMYTYLTTKDCFRNTPKQKIKMEKSEKPRFRRKTIAAGVSPLLTEPPNSWTFGDQLAVLATTEWVGDFWKIKMKIQKLLKKT